MERKLSLEDVAEAAPGLLMLLCNANQSSQREYLYQRVLYDAIRRSDDAVFLSSPKVELLKRYADTAYAELPDDIRGAVTKSVTRHYAPVFNAFFSLQVANLRLAKVLTAIKNADSSLSMADAQQMVNDAEKEWERGE